MQRQDESNTRSLGYQTSALTLNYRSRCRQLEREFSIYINKMVMPVKYKDILIIIFGIYTRCQYMNYRVMCRKLECREDIHYKTQTGTSCEKCNSKAFQLAIEPASSGLLDQCSITELQKPLMCPVYIWFTMVLLFNIAQNVKVNVVKEYAALLPEEISFRALSVKSVMLSANVMYTHNIYWIN